MSQVAAYGGFPQRYPHWRFGMEYEQLRKQQEYGLSRIYEMVINNDPCYAYLLNDNMPVDHKTVIAHVYAHCDLFKNNIWFSRTNRKMIDEMANHATRIRRYTERFGQDRVEVAADRRTGIDDDQLVGADQIRLRAGVGVRRGIAGEQSTDAVLQLLENGVRGVHGFACATDAPATPRTFDEGPCRFGTFSRGCASRADPVRVRPRACLHAPRPCSAAWPPCRPRRGPGG